MSDDYTYENLARPFEGGPFAYYGPDGVSYPYLGSEYPQSLETFRSQDNFLWEVAHSVRVDKITSRLTKSFVKRFDIGNGAFYKERMTREPLYGVNSSGNRVWPIPPYTVGYAGPVTLGVNLDSLRTLLLTDLDWFSGDERRTIMFGKGGAAIARTLPTASTIDLMVSLAEIKREGIPKLIGASLVKGGPSAKKFADEYLNYEFGWAPIIRDVVDLLKLVKDSGQMLRNFHSLAGKRIRRRYEFPVEETRDSFVGSANWSPFPAFSPLYKSGGYEPPTVNRTYYQRTWFSGAYQFAVSANDTLIERINYWEQEANKLLGIRITPEVLYNLTPWSWLLDWMVNIGDVMKNISYIGRDGLVLNYGYIMQHTRVSADITLPQTVPIGGSSPVSERVTLEQKVRHVASPYGFGITTEEFTPKQWSILAALGISRGHGVL